MQYFFDNCISWRLVDMLRALEVEAQSLRDAYPEDIKDVDLFAELKGATSSSSLRT